MRKKDNKRSKKNIIKILSIILISIIVFLLAGFSLVYFVVLNPRENISKLFNTTFDKTIEVVSKTSIDKASTSINKGNIKIDTNIENYKNLNDYEVEYDIENDRINNKTLIDLKFGDEEEKIDSVFYYEKGNLYVNFPYVISDIIKIPLGEYGYSINDEDNVSYKKEDVSYILNIIKNSFINNISEDKLKNSIDNYHIKSTYLIDNSEINKLLKSIINSLKKDDRAMRILNDNFKIKEETLDNISNKLISLFEKKCEFIEINMYITPTFKFDKLIINTKKYNANLLIDDICKLLIKNNDKEIITSSFNSKLFKASINRNNKIIDFDFEIDSSKDELNLEGFINYKIENDNYIKLDLMLSTLLNEKIENFDITEAKSFSQFTSKDLKSVYKIINLINEYIELFSGNKEHNINLKK